MSWSDFEQLAPMPGEPPDFHACLAAFPALELAKNTPQGAYHLEGDVWTHTKMVVEELLAHPEYQAGTRSEQVSVFFAALLHDVAKHSTTVVDPVTGAIGQPGHSRRGSIDARIALWDAGAPIDLREQVCRLIAVHQVPFFAFEGGEGKPSAEFLARRFSWEHSMKLLTLLAEADMRGRICEGQQRVLDSIELFREVARIDDCYDRPKAFSSAHTALSYFRGLAVDPSHDLFQERGSKVVVMAGLPASGKDTWVEAHFKGAPVVSFDDARTALGIRHGKNEGLVGHAAVAKAKALLRKGDPFVWNATHISSQMREKTLGLLFAYHAEVEIVYLESPRSVVMSRNSKRDTSLRNKAIEDMLFKWEVPMPTEAHKVSYNPS